MKLRTDLPLGWRVRAGVTALVIPILLLVVPLDRLTSGLGRSLARSTHQPPDRRIAAWIDHLLRRLPWPWRHTCLRRSAVLYHLLRRGGRAVELCVGVRRDEANALAAHAWLSLDGQPYLESGSEMPHEFAIIARFPEAVAGER
ncbi:MAG: lasso peptide biosynthesis B2 protein [Gemmatimonadales bacterium]|nr:lasso peptide biosynthesis B2 protein [Gemmatimonadales bacterium]